MKAARSELLGRLPKHGWSLERVEDDELEWWADEIWTLKSLWAGRAATVYLAFLVDPQAEPGGRKKGQKIWAVKASPKRPENWLGGEGDVYWELGADWRSTLPEFLEGLSKLLPDGRRESPEVT